MIQPQDRIMGLGLPDGGHLTHGAYTPKRKISASSIYFQSFPYQVDPKTGYIDYEGLEKNANLFKPRILICGASAYPRDWDYARLRKVADAQSAYLVRPLVATSVRLVSSPCADVRYGSHLRSRRRQGRQQSLRLLRRGLDHDPQDAPGSPRRYDLLPQGQGGRSREAHQ
jgi:glycine/serine hydroxymethyltransferase